MKYNQNRTLVRKKGADFLKQETLVYVDWLPVGVVVVTDGYVFVNEEGEQHEGTCKKTG